VQQVDIALDTYPFAGHTTTCHALWMGVPTVTRAGIVPISRVGLSLLRHVGLDDLATDSESSYIAAAVKLARDIGRIVHLRKTLREMMRQSALMDGKRLAREVEALFRTAISTG